MQLRLEEVSPAVILSVTQAGTQSRQIRAIVCESEEHKPASNGARAETHSVCVFVCLQKALTSIKDILGLSLVPGLV